MRKLLFLLALLIPVVIAGCEDNPNVPPNVPPGTPSTTGTWVGITTVSGVPVTVTLVLAEVGTNITGSGTVESVAGSVTSNLTGTHRHPKVTLTLQGPANATYEAAFAGDDDDTIIGTITGNVGGVPLNNHPLTVQRQGQ